MLNILFLTFNQVGRGTYWRAIGFAKQLAEWGHTVTFLTTSANKKGRKIQERKKWGVTFVECPQQLFGSGYDVVQMVQRMAWLRGRSYDLVHTFEMRPTNLGPLLQLKRHKVPIVIDWADWFGRNGSVQQRQNKYLRTILRPIETHFEERYRHLAAGTTVINHTLQSKAEELGIAPETIQLIRNGAYTDQFQVRDRVEMRRQLALPLDAPILAYTGAIFRQDARLMAETLNLIHAERNDVHLLLVGYWNVPLQAWVTYPDRMIETGPVTFPDLTRYISACDWGWLPLIDMGANQGRFPMKVCDFMAAGRPIFVTDVGDLGDVVRGYGLGVVSADSPTQIAKTILTALSQPTPDPHPIRQTAETDFSWSTLTTQLLTHYDFVMNQ